MLSTPMNVAKFALLCVVVIFQLSMVAEATGQGMYYRRVRAIQNSLD